MVEQHTGEAAVVRIGIVGIGFMGYIHFLAAQRLEVAGRVAAICSRDPVKRLGDWRSIRGNFGPPGTIVALEGIKTYACYEELLTDPEIDLVDICLPTDQHAGAVRKALLAGKHVLVEKPLTLAPEEAADLVELSRQTGRLLLVAHVLPFFPEFRFAHDFVRSGTAGPVRVAHFRRLISRPDWSQAINDVRRTGGPAIDLHVHDTHFVNLLWGRPRAVHSRGLVEDDAVVYQWTNYEFDQAAVVTSQCGAICQPGRPFVHGFEIHCEKASLVFDSAGQPLTLLAADGEVQTLHLPNADDPIEAFVAELESAVASVLEGSATRLLDASLACDALALCRAEEQSVRTGQRVTLA